MVPRQKYDVIHYLREAYLKPHNPTQYTKADDAYLAGLPKGTTFGPAPASVAGSHSSARRTRSAVPSGARPAAAHAKCVTVVSEYPMKIFGCARMTSRSSMHPT